MKVNQLHLMVRHCIHHLILNNCNINPNLLIFIFRSGKCFFLSWHYVDKYINWMFFSQLITFFSSLSNDKLTSISLRSTCASNSAEYNWFFTPIINALISLILWEFETNFHSIRLNINLLPSNNMEFQMQSNNQKRRIAMNYLKMCIKLVQCFSSGSLWARDSI